MSLFVSQQRTKDIKSRIAKLFQPAEALLARAAQSFATATTVTFVKFHFANQSGGELQWSTSHIHSSLPLTLP